MATKSEVRNKAASMLGILRLNQSLQDQDATRIEEAYDEVYEDLKKEGIATWASTAEVPTAVVPHMVAYVAYNCLSTYNVPVDKYNRILNKAGLNGDNAKREIRRLVNPQYVSQENAVDY